MESLKILQRIAKAAKLKGACSAVYNQFISAIESGNEKKAWQIVIANKFWMEDHLPHIKLNKIPVNTDGKLKFYKYTHLVWEASLKDGIKYKETSYYLNGHKNKQNTWVYKNGKLHGKSYGYYIGNRLESVATYKNGYLNGKRTVYNSDGSLYSILNYKDGLHHGECKMYHYGFIYHYSIHKNGHEIYRNDIHYHEE